MSKSRVSRDRALALPLDSVTVGEELRHRAAAISGFSALIAEEALDASPPTVEEHLDRLVANVNELRTIVHRWHRNDRPATRLSTSEPTREPLPDRERLLLVEDDDDHFEMVRLLLNRTSGGPSWDVMRARGLAEAAALLSAQNPTCTLVNLALPDAEQGHVVETLRALAPDQPIVVVTGYPENGVGVQAVRDGAQDYLIKGSMSAEVLHRSLRYAVERSRVKAVLEHQALHDGLTGLPNRTLLLERLNRTIARLSRERGRAAVMFVDLDRFKLVNDTLGHSGGDKLLIAVADRLRAQVRWVDTVARLGGDEYVVLVEDLKDEADAAALAEQLLTIFDEPFGDHWLAASIGIAILDGTIAPDVVLAHADTAMYRAKETGRAHWVLFDDSMHAALRRRMEIEQELALAVSAHQLELYYQPIFDTESSRVVAAEALVRWNHPTRGLLLPNDFLSIAEDSGQIVAIGGWVITEAALQTRAWIDADLVDDGWTTWVNVSPRQVDRPGLVESLTAALGLARLSADRIGLEITESALFGDDRVAARMTDRLHALGVRLAVDDFGTGYSSMRRLRELPMHHLKIDGSFVAGVATHEQDRAIVTACVNLAQAMGMVPVAEGVETQEQRDALAALGCHLLQGYWIAPPAPARAFRSLLLKGTEAP